MHGPLRFEVSVQADSRDAQLVREGVAQLFVERRLVIKTRCQTEAHISLPTRNPFDGSARGGQHFVIPAPPLQPSAHIQNPLTGRSVPFMFVLDVALNASGAHSTVASHGVEKLHILSVIRHRIARRVAPFPFADMVGDQFRLSAHAPSERVAAGFPFALVR